MAVCKTENNFEKKKNTLIQCTPLLVEKAGVTPSGSLYASKKKSAGERSTLRMRKDIQSPKQEQSVAPQKGLGPTKNLKNKIEKTTTIHY